MWIAVSVCILISAIPSQSKKDFTGAKVYSVTPQTECQLKYLKDLQYNAHNNKIDMWMDPLRLFQPVTISVPARRTRNFENIMKSRKFSLKTLSDNLQQWLDAEIEANPPDGKEAGLSEDYALDTYHTYPSISVHLNTLSKKYPKITTLENIGTTFKGNAIEGLKIGTSGSSKPAIWIDAGIHAREWIAPASAIYMINYLLKGYEEDDEEIKNMVETFDWYIFPCLNPDGYIYTWEVDRLWRKNLAPDPHNSKCMGADPNRNFDVAFGGIGTSNSSCSGLYHGRYPFSEAESKAVRDGVLKIGSRLQAYVDLHSYSQLIMFPYGFGAKQVDNYDDTMKLMNDMAAAIKETHGLVYKVGPIATTIYPVTGSSVDWAKDVAKVKYSFTIEERDTGQQGFMLSNSEIIPTSEEIFAAMKVLANTLQSEMTQ